MISCTFSRRRMANSARSLQVSSLAFRIWRMEPESSGRRRNTSFNSGLIGIVSRYSSTPKTFLFSISSCSLSWQASSSPASSARPLKNSTCPSSTWNSLRPAAFRQSTTRAIISPSSWSCAVKMESSPNMKLGIMEHVTAIIPIPNPIQWNFFFVITPHSARRLPPHKSVPNLHFPPSPWKCRLHRTSAARPRAATVHSQLLYICNPSCRLPAWQVPSPEPPLPECRLRQPEHFSYPTAFSPWKYAGLPDPQPEPDNSRTTSSYTPHSASYTQAYASALLHNCCRYKSQTAPPPSAVGTQTASWYIPAYPSISGE